eukprot:338810_1
MSLMSIQNLKFNTVDNGKLTSRLSVKRQSLLPSYQKRLGGRCRSLGSQINSTSAKSQLSLLSISQSTVLVTAGQIPAQYAVSVSAGQLEALRRRYPEPKWHCPWKLKTVLSGHSGWVRSLAVDVSNEWFVTGSNDRTIKIWDLASGNLRLTLTGHINAVTGLCVSDRHPYMFSVGGDKLIKCWDLEQNKTIRSYHAHLSGVYDVAIHPTIDVIVTCGRDSVARVWDIRTKSQVHVLTGHTSTVATVKTQAVDPQIITGSHDSTIRLWDLRTGRASSVLTNHKKAVRDVAIHNEEFSFCSASADNLKVWRLPKGDFMRNLTGADSIVNTLALNDDNVLVSGGDEGTLKFWDWKTGYCFQSVKAPPQPGSLDSEAGIFAAMYDQTGSRLITAEADKTIKIWWEDEDATPETHPVNYKPPKRRK